MSSVSISSEVKICLEENEKETLVKAFEILKELRHELFLKDDDSEEYWQTDGAMSSIKGILSNVGIFVKC